MTAASDSTLDTSRISPSDTRGLKSHADLYLSQARDMPSLCDSGASAAPAMKTTTGKRHWNDVQGDITNTLQHKKSKGGHDGDGLMTSGVTPASAVPVASASSTSDIPLTCPRCRQGELKFNMMSMDSVVFVCSTEDCIFPLDDECMDDLIFPITQREDEQPFRLKVWRRLRQGTQSVVTERTSKGYGPGQLGTSVLAPSELEPLQPEGET